MEKEEVSLTPEEVAGILKIAKNTVYEMIKRGELPAYRVGRKIRVELKDVETYKRQGKKNELLPESQIPTCRNLSGNLTIKRNFLTEEIVPNSQELVICGQDVLLDILTRYLDRHPKGARSFRYHVGSFPGLLALYQEKAHLAAIHLWDGEKDIYNIPYVRHLMPGIPTVIIHLACRMQGFYVAKNNPRQIKGWLDLTRSDIIFINREKGSGTRVLLDEQLHRLKVDRRLINGYDKEDFSHLAVASAVARGEADVALGNEKVSLQVRDIDFIPLQKERYELVIRKEDIEKPLFQAVLEIIRSSEFKSELQGLGDYDLTETGLIVTEV